MADFEKAINYVLQNEGGIVSNPSDRGGTTSYGITRPMLTAYRKKAVTDDDIAGISLDEAKDLYKTLFWTRLQVEILTQPIATAIFDMSVNQGQASAVKLAQKCLGKTILPDGIMGPDTLRALTLTSDISFIYSYITVVLDKYADLCINGPSQLCFLKGWQRRALRFLTLLGTT